MPSFVKLTLYNIFSYILFLIDAIKPNVEKKFQTLGEGSREHTKYFCIQTEPKLSSKYLDLSPIYLLFSPFIYSRFIVIQLSRDLIIYLYISIYLAIYPSLLIYLLLFSLFIVAFICSRFIAIQLSRFLTIYLYIYISSYLSIFIDISLIIQTVSCSIHIFKFYRHTNCLYVLLAIYISIYLSIYLSV